MPIVAHQQQPSLIRLLDAGHEVLTLDEARQQTIRELHIGLLNMMPDAALQATERQFLRLLCSSNRIMQIYPHLLGIDAQPRSEATRGYMRQYYESLESVQKTGLDALVITGANPQQQRLENEAFWQPLMSVFEWAREHVCSVVCSCLATHAYLQHFHQIERIRCQPSKRWGVFSHHHCVNHPLLTDTNTRFDMPHSHVYQVTREQLEAIALPVLAYSIEGGISLATSEDGFRFVFFQGHPEYDRISLLKEMKREVMRYVHHERDDYPPLPQHYFASEAGTLLRHLQRTSERARDPGAPAFSFPETELYPFVDNTWVDSGRAIFNNWLGLVYRLTDFDRQTPFMPNIDQRDPLQLREKPQ